MNCETPQTQTYSLRCLEQPAACCGLPGGRRLLLYFMGAFDRAHLWTGALKLAYLAPRLEALAADVVLVGDGGGDDARLGAAARLAAQLELPFPLIADGEQTLWQQYGSAAPAAGQTRTGLVLVDGEGCPAELWPLHDPGQGVNLPELLAALEGAECGEGRGGTSRNIRSE